MSARGPGPLPAHRHWPGRGRAIRNRLLLVTDAWAPQVNGVVRTLETTVRLLRARGWTVEVVSPDRFLNLPCPTYPDIRLALAGSRRVGALIAASPGSAVHIATEGPLGWAARRHCLTAGQSFTTSFHTRFPDYVAARFGVPRRWSWAALRRFHAPARAILTATPTLAAELAGHGLVQTRPWSRGVDLSLFRPGLPLPAGWESLARPILLSVGRVAVEKNLPAFLSLDVPGTKVVVGDGPALPALRARFPEAIFTGALQGEALARAYAGADLFVFPSRTDTFGLVLVEAMASGLAVAAFPVPGPLDVVADSGAGVLDADLGRAVERALRIPRAAALARAADFSWDRAVDQFVAAIDEGMPGPAPRAAQKLSVIPA